MGGMGVTPGAPSRAVSLAALGAVVLLLVALCCYFLYFCIGRILELSKDETLMSQSRTPKSSAPPPRSSQMTSQPRSSQMTSQLTSHSNTTLLTSQSCSPLTSQSRPPPALRESAEAMAALCRQHAAQK